jgi:hypothetical protein
LFLLCLTIFFPPFTFAFFVVSSCICTLIVYGILKYFDIYSDTHIPLAGLQSIFFGIALPLTDHFQLDSFFLSL